MTQYSLFKENFGVQQIIIEMSSVTSENWDFCKLFSLFKSLFPLTQSEGKNIYISGSLWGLNMIIYVKQRIMDVKGA